MSRFRIQSHGRLQEWVAEEKDYFTREGLEYEFLVKPIVTWSADAQRVDRVPAEIQRGAFRIHRGWARLQLKRRLPLDRQYGGVGWPRKDVG